LSADHQSVLLKALVARVTVRRPFRVMVPVARPSLSTTAPYLVLMADRWLHLHDQFDKDASGSGMIQ
jgi:hypothetical protein